MPFRYDPEHWRDRAEDMRRLARDTQNEEAKQMMLRIADDYDELASRTAEARNPNLAAEAAAFFKRHP